MSVEGADALSLAGVNDANLLELQRALGVRATLRGDTLTLGGTLEQIERATPVVQGLIQRIKVRAVGQEVMRSLTPGQVLVRIVRDELALVMGSQATDLNLNVPAEP